MKESKNSVEAITTVKHIYVLNHIISKVQAEKIAKYFLNLPTQTLFFFYVQLATVTLFRLSLHGSNGRMQQVAGH